MVSLFFTFLSFSAPATHSADVSCVHRDFALHNTKLCKCYVPANRDCEYQLSLRYIFDTLIRSENTPAAVTDAPAP